MRILKISLFGLLLTTLMWSCQKEYSLEGSNIKLPAGTWQFNDSTRLFKGNMDTAYVDTSAPTKILFLTGTSLNGLETFSLRLYSVDSFKVGTYKGSLSENDFNYFSSAGSLYQANLLTGEFIVSVTVLSNNRITGTFTGMALDSAGNTKTITLGKFTSAIKLKTAGSSNTGAGSLGVTAGSCTPVTISGIFTQGITFDPSNTVQVQATVTAPGTYTISTNTVNGVKFSKTGSFTATGIQNVVLTGTGTPLNSGMQNFTVTFGSSICNFSINFIAGTPPPPITDYFPMTLNSNWAYYTTSISGVDSGQVKVIGYNPMFSGNTYNSFESNSLPAAAPIDTSYFRKQVNDYYQYTDFSNYFGFNNPTLGEFIFLKDNVPVNTSWQSQTFTGMIAGLPISVTGYISMKILAKAVPVTVGALNFPDVIKVQYDYYLSIAPGVPFTTEQRWFARGVGLIHYDSGTSITDIQRSTIF